MSIHEVERLSRGYVRAIFIRWTKQRYSST